MKHIYIVFLLCLLGAIPCLTQSPYSIYRMGLLPKDPGSDILVGIHNDSTWKLRLCLDEDNLGQYEILRRRQGNKDRSYGIYSENEVKEVTILDDVYFDVSEEERSALMDFYNDTDGPHWKCSDGWGTDTPVECWYGVNVDAATGSNIDASGHLTKESHVYSIILPDNNLTGEIQALSRLHGLTSIDLENNHLSGSLPDLSNLPLLGYITLDNNKLSGTIPDLSNLSQLGFFSANGNQFTAIHPSALSSKEVYRFAIADNEISGDFPEPLFTSLMSQKNICPSSLFFYNNNFTNKIPEWAQKHENFNCYWKQFCLQKNSDKSVLDGVTLPAPSFNWVDLYGIPHNSADEYAQNDYTLLVYWSIDCDPSGAFILGSLKPFYERNRQQGFNILGIVENYSWVDEECNCWVFSEDHHEVNDYCTENGITWTNLIEEVGGEVDVSYVYSTYGFIKNYDAYGCAGSIKPQVILVDRQGHVVFQSCLFNDYWDVRPVLENLFGNPLEYYTSTDYTKDGEVLQLQSATVDKGIDLVFVGEGFVDKDMESGGKYEQKMKESMEQFFSQQPYESLRSRFNVYAVKAVSPNEVFSKESKHAIDKSDTKAFEYAKKAVGNNPDRMMVGVVYNTDYAIDRSYTVMYEGDNSFVAYMMDGVSKVLNHEMGGHGIAFLLDEYVEKGMEEQSPNEEAKAALDAVFANYGEGANVDWRNDPSEVKWAHFLSDSRYNDEGLGVYEGAWLYGHGAYRPSENSMMRHNDCGFNAPSREAIYKRVMKLSEGDSWTYDYETFVEFDAPAREAYKQQNNVSMAKGQSAPQKRIESRPPTIYKGTWRDAGKCEKVDYSTFK